MKSCLNGATTMPYSLEEDIRVTCKIGFRGLEIWIGKLNEYLREKSLDELRALLSTYEVEVPALCAIGGFVFSSKEEFKARLLEMERLLKIAEEIKSNYIIVCAEGLGGLDLEKAKERYASRIGEVLDLCSSYRIQIALEWFHEIPVCLEIVDAIGDERLGLVVDVFHVYRGDGNIGNVELIPGDLIKHVHIDDCIDKPRDKLTDKDRVYPGLGVIPLVEFLRILDSKDYNGYLSVELFNQEYWKLNPEEIALRALRTLREVVERSGLKLE